jgi:hypothetical protein
MKRFQYLRTKEVLYKLKICKTKFYKDIWKIHLHPIDKLGPPRYLEHEVDAYMESMGAERWSNQQRKHRNQLKRGKNLKPKGDRKHCPHGEMPLDDPDERVQRRKR